jgi:hypothetical protein
MGVLRPRIKLIRKPYAKMQSVFLEIPQQGNAPMLLLEVLSNEKISMEKCRIEDEDYFRIAIKADIRKVRHILNYIDANL